VDDELDRFKLADLCAFAASRGYRLIRREATRSGGTRSSTPSSLLMRHPVTDDKIVVRLDSDGHWTYFSIRDDRDNGTIIDFALRKGASNLAQVREELRGWSGELRARWAPPPVGYRPADDLVRVRIAGVDEADPAVDFVEIEELTPYGLAVHLPDVGVCV
jgi:hypothetical protein